MRSNTAVGKKDKQGGFVKLILGIDQGGTKTCAAVSDVSGNILSYNRSAGAYFPKTGIEEAMHCMMDAAENALNTAKLTLDDIDSVVAGVTGIDWNGDDKMIADELKKHIGNKKIIACNDCEIAYYGGATSRTGAVICTGTGINAAMFSPDGKKFVMGDYLKSSLQGATAISSRTIEAVFESELGALPETKLTDLYLDFSDETSVDGLLKKYMCDEDFSNNILSLCPQIKKIADEGDEVALTVLDSFAEELTVCFVAAMKKMNMLELNCDIVLAGSVFGRTDGLTAMVTEKIRNQAKNANIVNAVFEPVVGACILGILKNTGKINDEAVENLAVSAKKFGLLKL